MRARVRLTLGDTGGALAWARDRNLAVDDDLSYVRELEHFTLCRVLIARHPTDRQGSILADATRLLERLLAAAEEGQKMGSLVEILLLPGARAPGAGGRSWRGCFAGTGADARRTGGLRPNLPR